MTWEGISCHYKTNRIQSITLVASDHAFQIPPSIGNLTYLQSLFLSDFPHLTGPIPESISKLTNVMFLTISSTSISGPIPNLLGKLKNLADLDLSFKKLSGTLPPSLSHLNELFRFNFDNNKLTGPIPDSHGYLKNLKTFSLSRNQLSGRIPVSLARLNLYYINLSNNRFQGDASMLFRSKKMTSLIYLSRNLLAFDLGKVEFPEDLKTLDVSHNDIYGNLPLVVENLSLLNVSYNRLCGEIPKGGNLQSFGEVTQFAKVKSIHVCGQQADRVKQANFLGHANFLTKSARRREHGIGRRTRPDWGTGCRDYGVGCRTRPDRARCTRLGVGEDIGQLGLA
ncbi:unnamed protein product [Lupinus luteus]|uniref:Uncharacterized protein n=1 Tax=Lupinus luteus TaxID=3873 RepID=A0AAV1Y3D5_LUPLU